MTENTANLAMAGINWRRLMAELEARRNDHEACTGIERRILRRLGEQLTCIEATAKTKEQALAELQVAVRKLSYWAQFCDSAEQYVEVTEVAQDILVRFIAHVAQKI